MFGSLMMVLALVQTHMHAKAAQHHCLGIALRLKKRKDSSTQSSALLNRSMFKLLTVLLTVPKGARFLC